MICEIVAKSSIKLESFIESEQEALEDVLAWYLIRHTIGVGSGEVGETYGRKRVHYDYKQNQSQYHRRPWPPNRLHYVPEDGVDIQDVVEKESEPRRYEEANNCDTDVDHIVKYDRPLFKEVFDHARSA